MLYKQDIKLGFCLNPVASNKRPLLILRSGLCYLRLDTLFQLATVFSIIYYCSAVSLAAPPGAYTIQPPHPTHPHSLAHESLIHLGNILPIAPYSQTSTSIIRKRLEPML